MAALQLGLAVAWVLRVVRVASDLPSRGLQDCPHCARSGRILSTAGERGRAHGPEDVIRLL